MCAHQFHIIYDHYLHIRLLFLMILLMLIRCFKNQAIYRIGTKWQQFCSLFQKSGPFCSLFKKAGHFFFFFFFFFQQLDKMASSFNKKKSGPFCSLFQKSGLFFLGEEQNGLLTRILFQKSGPERGQNGPLFQNAGHCFFQERRTGQNYPLFPKSGVFFKERDKMAHSFKKVGHFFRSGTKWPALSKKAVL